jgi:Ca2+-binding EF-hand superfamily protein
LIGVQQKFKGNGHCEKIFSVLDRKKLGFLSIKDLQLVLPNEYNIVLSSEKIVYLFKQMDQDEDGLVKYEEFMNFFNKDYEAEL